MTILNLVVEDLLQEYALRKIIKETSNDVLIGTVYGKKGKNHIINNLNKFSHAAIYVPYLVLIDLDNDECAPKLATQSLNFKKHKNFLFRIAVREVEAWLLGDQQNLSSFLGIAAKKIHSQPETLLNPKEEIINLARKSNRKRIYEDLVPNGTARVGPKYNSCLSEFIENCWDIQKAAKACDSLKRTINAVKNMHQ